MKTKEAAEKLLSYIESNRRTGNTTLLLEGAKRYNKPFYVLGWSIEHANEKIKLNSLNNFGKPLSILQMDSTRGSGIPLAIDADIMGWLIGKLMLEFDKKDVELERVKISHNSDVRKYTTVANELMTKVENQQKVLINRGELLMKIQTMNWWERIFAAPRLIRQLFLLELNNNQI